MENILASQNIILFISLIIYGIVFYIQKAQFTKQNEILNKYEKIFSIINIDEIEKYVQLQKRSIDLSFSNREIELSNNENSLKLKSSEIERILNGSQTTFEKSNEITERLEMILSQNKDFVTQISELNIQEFKDLYSIINVLKIKNPILFNEINSNLVNNAKKYDKLKRDILKRL